MGSVETNISLPTALLLFCLPKKGQQTIVFEPAFCAIAKKGYPDPVSLRDGTQCFCAPARPPLAGQRGQRTFFTGSATHCGLGADNERFKNIQPHSSRYINMIRRSTKALPKEEVREFGFGNKLTDTATRLINKDGSFNVVRSSSLLNRAYNDLYHWFITMSWGKFFATFFAFFFGINALFAILYLLIGVEQFQGVNSAGIFYNFWNMYFFSAQTFTTVGYGHIAPVGWLASMVASVESVLGWVSFAMSTGLLYGRFARPVSRILYSENALIAPYKDKTAFEFRITNARSSQLIEVETEVILSLIDLDSDHRNPRRKYYNLALELSRVNLLSLSWTIVHPITESSPLYGVSEQDLADTNAEFWVFIKAFDDTFSQVVYQRTSYAYQDLIWGARFKPMYAPMEGSSKIRLELDKIDDIEIVAVPVRETEKQIS